MKRDGPVLIGVDGSVHSTRTLEWGLDEARLRAAEVLVVQAYQEPPDRDWAWFPELGTAHGDLGTKEYLRAVRTSIRTQRPGLRVGTRVLYGPPVPAVRALSDDAQLLVVGAHGHAGRTGVGSVALHLAAHARCPVAVVREGPGSPAPGAPVVVGVDGSPVSVFAVRAAAREAIRRGAPLTVLHARPPATDLPRILAALPPLAGGDPDDDLTHRPAHRAVTALRDEHPGLDVRTALVDDDPVRALVAAGEGAALLVVGSRGLGAFRGMLLGSVSHGVLREATGTVLVVGQDETGDEGTDGRRGHPGQASARFERVRGL